MGDVSDPNLLSNIPAWVQILANVAVGATVASASVFTYFRTRATPTQMPMITASTSTDDHGLINQFIAKALEIMERSAIAAEQTADSAQRIAVSMSKRDEDAEIDRRVAERMRQRGVDLDHAVPSQRVKVMENGKP